MAGWQSGYAAACKAVYSGSIPDSASIKNMLIYKLKYNMCFLNREFKQLSPSGGIGRHKGLKIPR